MSVAHVSSAVPQYQVPTTPKAKQDDERTESVATKAKEAATGKDSPVQVQAKSAVNVKA
jgi:hypothetical protein